jgi:hypothetical protein
VFACLLLGAQALAGDAPARETSPRRIAPPTHIPDPIVSTAPVATAVPIAGVPRAVRRAVVLDAARRFNVAESAVVLAQAEQVTWSDGALGCPEPGRMYTQALVSGYRIVAKTSAGAMLYHTDSREQVRVCGAAASRAGSSIHERLRESMQPGTNPPADPQPQR